MKTLVDALLRLYAVYAGNDAELVEINPLVVTKAGELVALDCKLTIDDSALARREALAEAGTREQADRTRDAGRSSWISSSSNSTAASACSPTARA